MSAIQEDDMLPLEDDSVKYIRNYLPQELKEKFSDDDIDTIVDLIYDFYEENGFFEREDETVEIDENTLVDYVVKKAGERELNQFETDDILFIVQGELAYCDSLGMFE